MAVFIRRAMLAIGLWACLPAATAQAQSDPKDWPMYNRDFAGTRYNRGETAINATNASGLEEKWRFPARGSDLQIGVIHATPIVVNGYVYFGTATDPTFYKLAPDGKVRWSYRNPARGPVQARSESEPADEKKRALRFQSAAEGVFASALVTGDTVYFGDIGGWFCA